MDMGVESDPPLSPELHLGTMNTSDMFETGWESSSGIESGMSGSGSSSSSSSFSPYGGLADDNLFLWDDAQHLDANLFQANLGDYFGEDADLLSLADNQPFEDNDFSFLQDSASNLSFASDISSSSSTITSYSIPRSPDHSMTMLEEEPLANALPLSTSSPLKPAAESRSSCPRLASPGAEAVQEPLITKVEKGGNSAAQTNARRIPREDHRSKESLGREGSSPRKSKKSRRSPLSPQLHQVTASGVSPSVPISLASEASRPAKIHTKENSFSPSKKVVNILDSNVKWSELSDSEQRAVGEGLEMVLSQCLGVRERLDLMVLLEPGSLPSAPLSYGDMEWTINLDDKKLETLRRFLRGLDCPADSDPNLEVSSSKKKKSTAKKNKKLLKEEKWHNFTKEKAKLPLGRKQGWDLGSKPLSTKKSLVKTPQARPPAGKCWSSLTKGSKVKLSPPKQHSKSSERKCNTTELLQLRTRSRKEYRQLMKERRSGLFEREEVVTLSASATEPCNKPRKIEEEEEEDDIDILG
ncbi:uncharacterized protein LOC134786625 isoform X2 [Penaeus indicus]|uniref:uncharacterized protein LOC134786625 isoform X2 n=1 Tax=Penaeus indicus TaxID=29960 RepID=UPI00300CC0D2